MVRGLFRFLAGQRHSWTSHVRTWKFRSFSQSLFQGHTNLLTGLPVQGSDESRHGSQPLPRPIRVPPSSSRVPPQVKSHFTTLNTPNERLIGRCCVHCLLFLFSFSSKYLPFCRQQTDENSVRTTWDERTDDAGRVTAGRCEGHDRAASLTQSSITPAAHADL